MGRHELMARSDLRRNRDSSLFFVGSEARRYRCQRDRSRPKDLVRDGEHERAIRPSRIANYDGSELPQKRAKRLEFAIRGGREWFWGAHAGVYSIRLKAVAQTRARARKIRI